jgi:hypothetical protein
LAIASFAVMLAGSGSAAGEPPAGIVMALSGSTAPPLAEMAEIPAGTPLHLLPGTQLTFLVYARCKLVTVAGGTLTLSRTDFTTDGKILGDKDGPCPRIHPLSGSGAVAGGLIMRGGALPRWPLDSEIVLAGDASDGVETAAIYAEDRLDAPLVRLDVVGHRLRLPAGAGRLSPNRRYLLRLTTAGRAQPLDLTFIGTAPDGPILLVVLRPS